MKLRLAALMMVAALTARAVAATPPTRDEALAAIKTLDEHLLSDAAAGAAKVITQFAQESKEVTFTLGADTVPWLMENPNPDKATRTVNSILLGVYLAGNAKSQFATGKAEDDPYAGWLAVIHAYPQLQAANQFKSPAIERLARQEAAGRLKQHGEDVKLKNFKPEPPPVDHPVKIVVPSSPKP